MWFFFKVVYTLDPLTDFSLTSAFTSIVFFYYFFFMSLKFFCFSKLNFNFDCFSKFIISNFKVGLKYCLLFRLKSFKSGFIKPCRPIYVEVTSLNTSQSLWILFNDLNKVIKSVDEWDSSLLSMSFCESEKDICILYVSINDEFNEVEFEKLANKSFPVSLDVS